MPHVRFTLLSIVFAVLLFVGMVSCIELGRRAGVRALVKIGPDAKVGVGIVDSAVFAVLALLIGFLFSGAAARFEHRRELVLQQYNTLSTAWLRIETLPLELQPAVRQGFRHYMDALIAVNEHPPGTDAELLQRRVLAQAEHDLWLRSVEASLTERGEKARMLLLPELNDAFDTVDLDRLEQRMHPPALIWVMLAVSALVSALFAGYGIASKAPRSWIHIVGVAATISVAMFVIIELESPRLGLIRMNATDRALVELRGTMD